MKCPLFGIYDHERKGDIVTTAPDCLKEDCAWWSKSFQKCDINILTQELWELRQIMTEIKDQRR